MIFLGFDQEERLAGLYEEDLALSVSSQDEDRIEDGLRVGAIIFNRIKKVNLMKKKSLTLSPLLVSCFAQSEQTDVPVTP